MPACEILVLGAVRRLVGKTAFSPGGYIWRKRVAGETAGDSSQVSAEQQERLPWQHEDRVAAAGAKVWRWRSTLSP